jgi:aldehyde dehydrogenase
MAAWKLAPALAAGNAIVLKPAETTPVSIMVLLGLMGHLLPAGVLNVVNGYGTEAGAALASSKRIAKIAFTGSTAVGRRVAAAAAANLIPATLELGGKSPNVFFSDIMAADDALFDKALEGFAMFAFNSGEVCTCPSRALVQADIFDAFMARALPRVAAIRLGDPLDPATALGAQNSALQLSRILAHIEAGKAEGAQALCGGGQATLPGGEAGGFYVQPTVFKGHNKMRIFQEEVFGPVLAVTTFTDEADAIALANDSSYGLGAGVWTRDANVQFRMAKAIKAGRVWCNCYHAYPAGAAFGGYKESGIGRETHKAALSAYQQTKNVLTSYCPKALGFF